jgi:hypothetical protein
MQEDKRKKPNGQPLRRSRDLRFLDMSQASKARSSIRDLIYEVQVSCLVSGLDQDSWVGYLFVDTYHRGESNRESVQTYASRVIPGSYPHNLIPDPLTAGKYDANKPIWKPREYFLRVFESRAEQVKEESQNLVVRLLQKLEPHVSPHVHYDALHRRPSSNMLSSQSKADMLGRY